MKNPVIILRLLFCPLYINGQTAIQDCDIIEFSVNGIHAMIYNLGEK